MTRSSQGIEPPSDPERFRCKASTGSSSRTRVVGGYQGLVRHPAVVADQAFACSASLGMVQDPDAPSGPWGRELGTHSAADPLRGGRGYQLREVRCRGPPVGGDRPKTSLTPRCGSRPQYVVHLDRARHRLPRASPTPDERLAPNHAAGATASVLGVVPAGASHGTAFLTQVPTARPSFFRGVSTTISWAPRHG